MKLIRISFFAISLIANTSYVLGAETSKCTDSRPLPPSGKRITDIELTSEAGAVVAVSYLGMFTTGKGTPGYNCHFDATKKNTVWVRQGAKSAATVTDEFEEKSYFSVTTSGTSYRIDFEDMGRNWCGAQAEFPRSVEIIKGVSRCKVQY